MLLLKEILLSSSMEAALVLESANTVVTNNVVGIGLDISSLDGTSYRIVLDDKSKGSIELNDEFDMEVRLLKGTELIGEYELQSLLKNIILLNNFCGLNFFSNGELKYTEYMPLNDSEAVGWFNVVGYDTIEYEFVLKQEEVLSQHEGTDVVGGGTPI